LENRELLWLEDVRQRKRRKKVKQMARVLIEKKEENKKERAKVLIALIPCREIETLERN